MMNTYRVALNVDEEVKAETPLEAWQVFKSDLDNGVYGPTIKDVELIEEGKEEEESPSQEKEE